MSFICLSANELSKMDAWELYHISLSLGQSEMRWCQWTKVCALHRGWCAEPFDRGNTSEGPMFTCLSCSPFDSKLLLHLRDDLASDSQFHSFVSNTQLSRNEIVKKGESSLLIMFTYISPSLKQPSESLLLWCRWRTSSHAATGKKKKI